MDVVLRNYVSVEEYMKDVKLTFDFVFFFFWVSNKIKKIKPLLKQPYIKYQPIVGKIWNDIKAVKEEEDGG